MATNAERQRKFKAKLAADGLVQVSGFVHPHQLAKLQLLIAALRSDVALECGPAVDERTRRFVKYDR